MTAVTTIRSDHWYDVQCDKCKALHPLRQQLGGALSCMDTLNNSQRPCPACGAKERWVLKEVSAETLP